MKSHQDGRWSKAKQTERSALAKRNITAGKPTQDQSISSRTRQNRSKVAQSKLMSWPVINPFDFLASSCIRVKPSE
jgi:hypothetical protein